MKVKAMVDHKRRKLLKKSFYSKKHQIQEDKFQEIQKNNRILFRKILEIISRKEGFRDFCVNLLIRGGHSDLFFV